jgi:hypothetical protein
MGPDGIPGMPGLRGRKGDKGECGRLGMHGDPGRPGNVVSFFLISKKFLKKLQQLRNKMCCIFRK